MNGYELSHKWFEWAFENPDRISPTHTAIYFFAIEQCNRLGWKEKFGFPTNLAMEAIGVKKHQTYSKHFDDLVEWGFIKVVQKSTNQYSANIISINDAMPKNGKALGKALAEQWAEHGQSIGQSTGQSTGHSMDSIIKLQTTNLEPPISPLEGEANSKQDESKPEPKPKRERKQFVPPTYEEVYAYFLEKGQNINEARKAYDHYNNHGWKDSHGKQVVNWKQKIQTNWFKDLTAPTLNFTIKLAKHEGDAQMNRLLQKGLDTLSGQELEWIYNWQHRDHSAWAEYDDEIRLVSRTSSKTKAQCIEDDRRAGYGF